MLISEFYANKDIFITGGTGFIGKAIIEKLLRSCPDVGNIFVLVRAKKNQSLKERFDTTLKDPAFDYMWREKSEVLKKIQPIQGDCAELGLGISKADLERMSNVQIIFHSAATVRFDAPLREALLLNTRSIHELIKIAKKFRNLKAFVHVSTAYSNPAEAVIKEQVYAEPIYWREAVRLAENLDEEMLNVFMVKIRNRHPNTYTFTKNLGEQIVNEFSQDLPITIFRPSIVISSLEEPTPGWVDNVNGPIGALVASAAGLKRCELCNPETILALIPVDIVTRSMLIAAYKLGTRERNLSEEPKIDVYNCVVSGVSPLTLNAMIWKGQRTIRKYPFEKTLWAPAGMLYKYPILYFLHVFFFQFLFAIILDGYSSLMGKKPKITKIQRIIMNAGKVLIPFMMTTWDFETENFFELENYVPETEKKDFSFLKQCYIDYDEFYPTMIAGMRIFILKEPKHISTKAQIRMKILIVIQYICDSTFILLLTYLAFQCIRMLIF